MESKYILKQQQLKSNSHLFNLDINQPFQMLKTEAQTTAL
jgi:hypothetical protein